MFIIDLFIFLSINDAIPFVNFVSKTSVINIFGISKFCATVNDAKSSSLIIKSELFFLRIFSDLFLQFL